MSYTENDWRLYSPGYDDFLCHYGVKGMKWGKHKAQKRSDYEIKDTALKTWKTARRLARGTGENTVMDRIRSADKVQAVTDDMYGKAASKKYRDQAVNRELKEAKADQAKYGRIAKGARGVYRAEIQNSKKTSKGKNAVTNLLNKLTGKKTKTQAKSKGFKIKNSGNRYTQ